MPTECNGPQVRHVCYPVFPLRMPGRSLLGSPSIPEVLRYPGASVACRWQAVSGMEARNPKEHDDDHVVPFALS